ncbi:MAG TPA: hypothetical protein VFW33_20275 [Gemmataceae bacterium]|nr:hypothetical protein [Gemmataceae bacterium]
MGIHYTVYCKKVAHVSPAELLKGVTAADLPALAKKEGVPDDEIESALDVLHVENLKPPYFVVYRLCYRKSGMRQVDVECWEEKDDVQAVLDEELEELAAERHPHYKPIRDHLKRCVDVIDTSIGNPNEAVARVLAREVARWLARHFDGIIRTADEKWWRLGPAGELVPL